MFLRSDLKSRWLTLAFALSAVFLTACQKPAHQPSTPKAALKVSVVVAHPTQAAQWVSALGEAQGVAQAEVRAQVSGLLQEVAYREGARVKAGQTLFVIDPAPYRAALDSAAAARRQVQSQLEQDQREEARMQKLFAAKACSRKAWDDAKSAVAIRRAMLASAQAQESDARINLTRTRVKAPSDGVVSAAEVNPGALITASTTLLAHITQPEALRVKFSVSERDLAGARISRDNRVRVRTPSGHMLEAHLDYVAAQMDPQTATRTMRARLDATNAVFLPGQFVHVELQTHMLDGVFRVAQQAVLQRPDGTYQVFVERDGKARAVTVRVGRWIERDWIVLSGLADGDRVIVDNIARLREGVAVQAEEKSEAHTPVKLPASLRDAGQGVS